MIVPEKDSKDEKKQETETIPWSTGDSELSEIIQRAKIPPKKFDPKDIVK
jgi:hypothetical protein